jgi:hypothetical protein
MPWCWFGRRAEWVNSVDGRLAAGTGIGDGMIGLEWRFDPSKYRKAAAENACEFRADHGRISNNFPFKII